MRIEPELLVAITRKSLVKTIGLLVVVIHLVIFQKTSIVFD
jgi:hypothetical protein